MLSFQHEHLKTLIALADHGSFEAAATELHMSASAVSQWVKAMEDRCGTALVRCRWA